MQLLHVVNKMSSESPIPPVDLETVLENEVKYVIIILAIEIHSRMIPFVLGVVKRVAFP